MKRNRIGAETLIFWGAGATASIGLRVTQLQAEAIKCLVGQNTSNEPLEQRVEKVLKNADKWRSPLIDLLRVLGDDGGNVYDISKEAIQAMRRHWHDQNASAVNQRISELRAVFDWSALKIAARICPGFSAENNFKLQDLFNVIDLHIQIGHGFSPDPKVFLSADRLRSARRALQLILNTLFYIDWQNALANNQQELQKHLDFAALLTKHHQTKGIELSIDQDYFDRRDFYLGDVAFCSLNYDPVALWAQFIANRKANNASPPHIGFPCAPLKIFHDFGIFMAVSTIDPKTGNDDEKERVWYPLNEAAAQRLNDRDHHSRRVRINKFLFPHGCLCWRECPNCGKLSSYMGKTWDFFSQNLMPPPPLRGFVEPITSKISAESTEESNAWERGEVDARACVHCGELTFAQHTQAIMQSNFKSPPASFIEEVQRDLRVATQAANHIILMGYSLPADDVTYRAFLAARQQRENKQNGTVAPRCSVVVGLTYGDEWHSPTKVKALLAGKNLDDSERGTLQAACDLFGDDNVRFYGGGIPQVFCEGNIASQKRLKQLINWTDK